MGGGWKAAGRQMEGRWEVTGRRLGEGLQVSRRYQTVWYLKRTNRRQL